MSILKSILQYLYAFSIDWHMYVWDCSQLYVCTYTYIHLQLSFMSCCSYVNLISGKRKRQRKESSDLESDSDSMSPANCIVYEVPITLEFTLLKN